MKKPTLCMLVHGPYPFGQPPRVVREVAAAVGAGFTVDVIATRRPGEPRRATVDGVRVTRLPVTHRRGVGPFSMVLEYVGFALMAFGVLCLRSLRQPYRVVQVHNPPDFLVFSALVAKVRGSRIVFDVHDLAPDMFAMRFGESPAARPALWLLRRIERIAGAAADAVVTVHEPYRAELNDRGIAAAKTTVVMNTVDPASIPPPNASPAAAAPFRIVYHGTVTPHYGLSLLVDAFARIAHAVPHARLEVYGEGDAVPELREKAAALDLQTRISVTDEYLPHREILQRISGANVGVVANLPIGLNRFALSTKLFEYCALGIPAVVSALPTLCAHFNSNEVVFFEPGSAEALADALLLVAGDPAGAATRAKAAQKRLEQYSWEESRSRYTQMLTRLVASDFRPLADRTREVVR